MNWKRIYANALFALLSFLLLVGCASRSGEETCTEVNDFVESYFADYSKSTEDSVKYCVFTDESLKEAYIRSGDRALEHTVNDVKQIGKSLYEISVTVKTQAMPDIYQDVFNFVVEIDGTYYYAINISQVPEEYRTDVDTEKYAPPPEAIDPSELF